MDKAIKYLKGNLLGVAVALGVCSFTYEGLIHPSYDFTLTECSGALIFLIASYSKIKDNRIRASQMQKKNNEL